MKRITIGRNPSCDVVIDNRMVSRNHALLNIYPTGKLEIISMGTNGTKVKGHLISNGQRYPLRRGDDVTFAGTANLDWSLVPDPLKIWKIVGAIVGGVLIIALLVWALVALKGSKSTPVVTVEEEEIEQVALPSKPSDSHKEDDKKTDDKKTDMLGTEKESEKKQDDKNNYNDLRRQLPSSADKDKPETKPTEPKKPQTKAPEKKESNPAPSNNMR